MLKSYYSLLKKILFQLDPERAHYVALKGLQFAYQAGLLKLFTKQPTAQPITLMGLIFPHRLGLAAGLDKNADYIDALAALGFAFIEIGTVTPQPQPGNSRPRLFRLTKQEAIINRMGFNNKGVSYVAERLAKTHYKGILGINIGKNKNTPLASATDDYLFCFKHLWKFASYMTINISSPNTQGLRDLQQADALNHLLTTITQERNQLAKTEKYIPLAVKISPDLSIPEIEDIASILLQHKIDALIATNTTLSRDGVEQSPFAQETGGLSGRPLQARSTRVIEKFHQLLQDKIPIIGVGGIMDQTSAQEKLNAGAKLLQVYTGFIYHGPEILDIEN